MSIEINRQKLAQYILETEVVFQYANGLVTVAHGGRDASSKNLSSIVKKSPSVKLVEYREMEYDFFDLVDWSIEETDVLVFVEYDALICIPP